MDTGDADVAAAAPPGLHDVAVLRREPGGHDVVDLTGYAPKSLSLVPTLHLQNTACIVQRLLNEPGDHICDSHIVPLLILILPFFDLCP